MAQSCNYAPTLPLHLHPWEHHEFCRIQTDELNIGSYFFYNHLLNICSELRLEMSIEKFRTYQAKFPTPKQHSLKSLGKACEELCVKGVNTQDIYTLNFSHWDWLCLVVTGVWGAQAFIEIKSKGQECQRRKLHLGSWLTDKVGLNVCSQGCRHPAC